MGSCRGRALHGPARTLVIIGGRKSAPKPWSPLPACRIWKTEARPAKGPTRPGRRSHFAASHQQLRKPSEVRLASVASSRRGRRVRRWHGERIPVGGRASPLGADSKPAARKGQARAGGEYSRSRPSRVAGHVSATPGPALFHGLIFLQKCRIRLPRRRQLPPS